MLEYLRTALSSIYANKLRSGLTMLGVIIGVASVVVMVAIGQGTSSGITSRLQSLGTNVLIVSPGSSSGFIGGAQRGGGSGGLSVADVAALEALPDVLGVSPQVSGRQQLIVGSLNMNANVMGVRAAYMSLASKEIRAGSFFGEDDVTERSRVAVITESVASTLFPGANPLGQQVRAGNVILTVIGVMKGSDDNTIYIPVTTAQLRLLGTRDYSSIYVYATTAEVMSSVEASITAALLRTHKVADADNADFSVTNQATILETLNEVTAMLTLMLGGIAGISLVVGGIGVMNIMLVSVTERTREIGIRKAIGAHRNDILLQFLTEAIILSLLGGAIGIALSFTAIAVLGQLTTSITAIISWSSVAYATGFSVLIGVVFGLLPAHRASRLRPIDALRYE